MQEKLITRKTAELAKEKGFNENTRPSQSLLQRWLREVHNIHIEIARRNEKWCFYLNPFHAKYLDYWNDYVEKMRKGPFDPKLFKTYELALEQGLQEALKLIENEQIQTNKQQN